MLPSVRSQSAGHNPVTDHHHEMVKSVNLQRRTITKLCLLCWGSELRFHVAVKISRNRKFENR